MNIRIMLAALLLVAAVACSSDDTADTTTDGEATAAAVDDAATEAADPAADTADAGSLVTEVDSDLGTILATGDGFTLYGFLPDLEAGAPTCAGDCAGNWPILTVDGGELPSDLDASLYTVVDHPDGVSQLQIADVPLYLFAGDAAAGETNGQGVGENWFVVAPDGSLIQ